jgi:putative molybdopterin biosynthesis protein
MEKRMKRNIYLKMKSLVEAKHILKEAFSNLPTMPGETVSTPDAVGRVLAQAVEAKISSPNFHAAAMDGIAVSADITYKASETNPKKLILEKEAFFVNTGHVMPLGTNAVIMIENVQLLDDNTAEIESPAFPWQHVRKMGEDIVATELLFPQNHLVTPYSIGALISGGIFSVSVRKKPRVLIIPTGSELVDWRHVPPENLRPGQVLETNSVVLGKLVEGCGGSFVRHETVMDNTENIKSAVLEAVDGDFDVVLTIGGSSAGSEDYAKAVLVELGEVLVHGVTIMPGKPVLIGKVRHKPVFGMPGYPVSAIVAFEQFVSPLILSLLGQPEIQRPTVPVLPTRKIPSKLGQEEFLRVKLGAVEDNIVATPLPRGAGIITSITEADGIIRIPNTSEGLNESEPVDAELLRPMPSIQKTIVAVGSHDNTLDLLSDFIKARHSNLSLSSSHVGSMGGLMAIRRGVCHLAGSHLLDTTDGTYNLSYINKYLKNIPVKLVNLVLRDQGLIVSKGNPKEIARIEDFTRKDILFINRQAGSGTRILLDYHLNKLGIDPLDIRGYQSEEYTHMSVAVAVLSESVDVGLGILAAAKALDLDFIPLVTEQYDLIIPEIYFESENIQTLLEIIKSSEFQKRVRQLGGYSTELTGKILI